MTPVLLPPGISSSMKATKPTCHPVGLVGPNEASKVHLGTLVGVVCPILILIQGPLQLRSLLLYLNYQGVLSSSNS
jgi:hypothetical protein